MTRSASPNGAIEFSYDFPVAGPSRLPPTPARTARTHTQPRTRSPTRPQWEASYEENLDDDDEIDYDAFGYPRVAHRAATVPAPTRNQWRAPSPTLYPYADAYSAYPYAAPLPLLLAPAPSSSYESESALSSCARSCHSHKSSKESKREHAKIRKPRRSVDEDSAPAPSSFTYTYTSSPASSPHSSPYFSSHDDFSDDEDYEEERDLDEHEKENTPAEEGHHGLGLRKQWDALSLRVRFGVFRAKRRMRKRVLSL